MVTVVHYGPIVQSFMDYCHICSLKGKNPSYRKYYAENADFYVYCFDLQGVPKKWDWNFVVFVISQLNIP
jgi:hypothetical protein